MKENLIILTTGSSGSSVLAGIIATQGYWLGEETKKLAFDTYENARLVDLNAKILRFSGFRRKEDCNDIPPPLIPAIERVFDAVDTNDFSDFLEICRTHRPWLWKDPRLSFTIHFWKHLMDFTGCKFIFIDREPDQSYTGLILRRKVPMDFDQQIQMNLNYQKSCGLFFQSKGIEPFYCTFEELLLTPDGMIEKLNIFLDTDITMNDVRAIYQGRLGKKRYGKGDFLKSRFYYLLHRYVRHDHVRFPRG